MPFAGVLAVEHARKTDTLPAATTRRWGDIAVTFYRTPMTRIAIYPGSFDPPTRGHEDLIRRALALADHLIVAVAINPNKAPLFSVEERLRLLKIAAAGDDPRDRAGVVRRAARRLRPRARRRPWSIRGLRAVSDFEYEFQMALMNRKLNDQLETVFLVPAVDLTYLSSSLVREVARFGGPLDGLVIPPVAEALKARFRQ